MRWIWIATLALAGCGPQISKNDWSAVQANAANGVYRAKAAQELAEENRAAISDLDDRISDLESRVEVLEVSSED